MNTKLILSKLSSVIPANCDKDKDITVFVDASRYGLGAVLLQDNKTVAYGSTSLTETQQRHTQTEKELLSVIFGFGHFNYLSYI